jgi:signal transduction histidine kinase
MRDRSDIESNLPWWTYPVTLAIIHAGTEVSLLFKYDQGVADYYLPTALALILVNWWGPKRVLPIMYLNAALSTWQWGIPADRWYQWFLYGVPETLCTFLSWYLFRKLCNGKFWLPDIQNTLLFLIFGILVPTIPEIGLLQSLLVLFGDQTVDTFWIYSLRNWLGEFTSSFGLAVPILYYFSPVMYKAGLLAQSPGESLPPVPEPTKPHQREMVFIIILILFLVFSIDFQEFWYIYGLISLYTAIRFGFGPAVAINYFIFLLIYIMPRILNLAGLPILRDYTDSVNIFLGASLLFLFAAITGRVITDVRIAEVKLQQQNLELEQTNKELDRFVYSVSHDLSAPLKSILGLVNISRITPERQEHTAYLNRIESSVKKLEVFINEILDYSRNKRQEIVVEQVKLKDLCMEILENLKYIEEFNTVRIDLNDLDLPEIHQDKIRLRIILNNLLTNAVKFQKRIPGHTPFIKVRSLRKNDAVFIQVEDNGEGIRPELQGRIFDMFYRGNENSKGSGLGLYIAKEAAMKIQGNISVKSEYGKGSVFTVELKDLNNN